ncbi:MAG: hypothetical protein JSW73_01835 [Candidatus Woesearchaeota archaeon]|nr:MAG: hypothetical protein JSW73_01835 [Candidatus Woesearchaeota archaeon]
MEEKYGEAISIAKSKDEKKKILEEYIKGKPEAITSKLAVEPVLRSSILGLISTGFIYTEKGLFDFFKSTFYGFQYKDDISLNEKLIKILEKLEKYEFIVRDKEKLKVTLLGKRIAELYIDPESAWTLINGLKNGTGIMPAISVLQLICSTIEMEPLRVTSAEWDEIQAKLINIKDRLLLKEPSEWDPEYEFFTASVKTAFILEDWIEEKSEEHILEKYKLRPGELYVKLQNADWLLYSCQELARILNLKPLQIPIRKTRLRMKYGIRETLIPLVKLRNVGRVRARRLFNIGVKDLGDLKRIDINKLSRLFGTNIAISLKNQVGVKIDSSKITKTKKRGQQDLNSY